MPQTVHQSQFFKEHLKRKKCKFFEDSDDLISQKSRVIKRVRTKNLEVNKTKTTGMLA